jgi:cytochrome c-type biogenesis protein CcmE
MGAVQGDRRRCRDAGRTGILPDLFREAAIATGRMDGRSSPSRSGQARRDLHAQEVADKMGMAHKKHDVATTAPAGTQPAKMEAP